MGTSFLPTTDNALLAWSLNFSTLISATPTTYGLSATQATAYATLHSQYSAALATATNPTTRTKANVAAKNTARDALKTDARLLAKIVDGQATVTNQQRIQLGLNVRTVPTPVPVPSLPPEMDIVSVVGRTVKIRVHNSATTKRARPAGVTGTTIFSYVGATPPNDVTAWTFQGNTSKTVVDIAFGNTLAAGSQVWLCAFWYNGKGQSGPACTPVTTYLAGGNVSAMAA
jgi:hypothetical protein